MARKASLLRLMVGIPMVTRPGMGILVLVAELPPDVALLYGSVPRAAFEVELDGLIYRGRSTSHSQTNRV